jgi:hypothetical protein
VTQGNIGGITVHKPSPSSFEFHVLMRLSKMQQSLDSLHEGLLAVMEAQAQSEVAARYGPL